MTSRIDTFRRLWTKSPRLAFAWLTRRTAKDASKLLPKEDWLDWRGEETRPFVSLQRQETTPTT